VWLHNSSLLPTRISSNWQHVCIPAEVLYAIFEPEAQFTRKKCDVKCRTSSVSSLSASSSSSFRWESRDCNWFSRWGHSISLSWVFASCCVCEIKVRVFSVYATFLPFILFYFILFYYLFNYARCFGHSTIFKHTCFLGLTLLTTDVVAQLNK
jgi:hypothetical protein